MMDKNVGLVLEGGGMRGAYTSGVLAAFMDGDIRTPYVIGVSAGASNGANYVSGQRERNKKVFVDHVKDKEYSGLTHWIKKKSYFNMDFLYGELPNEVVPFDYEAFDKSKVVFKACVTHCETGKPVYFEKSDFDSKYYGEVILRASSSLPIISQPVEINGELYYDGGIVDSIPIEKSIEDGNDYNIIILTRNKDYRKGPQKLGIISKRFLKKHPKLYEAIKTRHIRYNKVLDKIDKLEDEGKVFVFRPIEEIKVDRLEKDVSKLNDLYEQGYSEAMKQIDDLKKWLNSLKNNVKTY
ncbi:patatin family protein [Anaerosalibacter bizertensis]|uniref:Patatin family protein n=1 Tax=Anaerosalibacter bizertensis TaxID=932217 RepID=A0A9Q4ACC1_9FIRM|nr:patatin family protein [Anaerosalibacter bizertensis]MBV1818807.1 patatin family protein [Bacteroidales bacterium MSK.15.36]MCB5559106.1 patatin family protein [Anaerosalibacter bizertensis]MCG4565107.1 patatin family protein [Anaerosalibacter bizertensis]MCG4581887.1 patatin family protein [Anaerosalibacter bizertensis]MCG4584071.1 patatin family protein [Anaerosalibacter bizertensis]